MPPKREAVAADTAAQSKKFRSAIDESVSEFLCPITQELPVDPVIAEDSKVYERSAIEQWLDTKATSPVTNLAMGNKLLPALHIKNMLRAMVKSGAVNGEKADQWHQRLKDEDAVEEKKRKASAGNVSAANTLARWYSEGAKGLPKDDVLSFKYSKQSADAGDVYGCHGAACDLLRGRGTKKCPVTGMHYLTRAAEMNYAKACLKLGQCFADGVHGVPKDTALARRYFVKLPSCHRYDSLLDASRKEATEWLRLNPA